MEQGTHARLSGVSLPLDVLALILQLVPKGEARTVLLVSKAFYWCQLTRVSPPWQQGCAGLMFALERDNLAYYATFAQLGKDRVQWTSEWEDEGPLRYACILGFADFVHYFLQNGCNPNVRNGEPFRRACEYGHELVLKLLIASGLLTTSHQQRQYAMRSAFRNNHISILKILEENQLLLWDKSELYPCMMDVCCFGRLEALEFLNCRWNEDWNSLLTPAFKLALQRQHVSIICILIQRVPAVSRVAEPSVMRKIGERKTGDISQESNLSDCSFLSVLSSWRAMAEKAKQNRVVELIDEELADCEPDNAIVMIDFTAENDDQMSIYAGETIVISSQDDSEWWRGRVVLSRREGLFPASSVEII